jgi:hypothetical protein
MPWCTRDPSLRLKNGFGRDDAIGGMTKFRRYQARVRQIWGWAGEAFTTEDTKYHEGGVAISIFAMVHARSLTPPEKRLRLIG